MKKNLKVVEVDTGNVLHDIEFTGGYDITYNKLEDGGDLKYIRTLENGKYDDKLWIKNYLYMPVAVKVIEKFEELNHITPKSILFLEDMNWEKKRGMRRKQKWIAKIAKTNKQLLAMTGYQYIMTIRNFYTKDMSDEQVVALIYHELKHIGDDGQIENHDIEDWGNMVATLGTDWATTRGMIADILAEGFEFKELRKNQLSMFDDGKIVPMRSAK